MHDPQTVAFEIALPLPWKRYGMRAKLSLVTIWHVDPETDGSDDSCSVRKRLNRKHGGELDHMGGDEARSPWVLRERAKQPSSPGDAEALLRGALWQVARCAGLHRWSLFHRRITFAGCAQLASELLHNTIDNVRSSLCLLPGWHTNERKPDVERVEIDIDDDAAMECERRRPADDDHYPAETSAHWREDLSKGFFRMCGRILSDRTARWWQHSRWHFWHWKFQVHAWQWLRRRFFERCDECNERFRGSSEVYTDWNGTRRWCGACHRKANEAAALGQSGGLRP